jgi:hypothetical protein
MFSRIKGLDERPGEAAPRDRADGIIADAL